MSITLIAILAVVIIALFIVNAKQKKQDAAPSSKASKNNKKTSSANKKSAPTTNVKVDVPETPAKPKIDLDNLLTKLDVLIGDKEYAKAEGMINLNLNQDSSLHALYFKLLKIYQLQQDDFAIKQLFDTVQNLNLNTVYQELYNEQEAYKEEQELLKSAEITATSSPDVIEFVSSDLPTETDKPVTAQNNTQAFDSLAFDFSPDISSTKTTENEQNSVENTQDLSQIHSLDFSSTVSESDDTSSQTPPEETTTSNELEFTLADNAIPAEPSSLVDTELEFNFNLENPTSTDTQAFNFSLTPEEKVEKHDDTNLGQLEFAHEEQPVELDFVADEISIRDEQTALEQSPAFADNSDPIVQAFSELSTQDPVDLDIALAEQYIYLGDNSAAKQLLSEQSAPLSNEQSEKVQQLLEKIA